MSVPFIPESAPFNAEQRAWLNGFLAGLFSDAPTAAAPAPAAAMKFTLFFASQSGTAERLAKKFAKELKAQGHIGEIVSLAKAIPADLTACNNAVFLVSTYGEGDPPESAVAFRDALFADTAPPVPNLCYSVFALGDKHYEHFCKFGADLDDRLSALGAQCKLTRVEADVEVDAPFDQWRSGVLAAFNQTAKATEPSQAPSTAGFAAADEPAQTHTRDNPYHAELYERVPLTRDVSSKLTLHLGFDLADSDMQYQAGDACGVVAQNDPALVDEILSLLPFAGDATITLAKLGERTVREALLHHLQPTRLTRRMMQHFAQSTQAKELTTLLLAEEAANFERFAYDRGLIDLLYAYPGAIGEAAELAAILPSLAPRLYSISSSPAAHGRHVHCTIAVVRYRSHNRERGGVASTMLSDRTALGERLPIYIQPNKKFRLPAADVPVIMIGPGTGIAPFRAFLHERQALGHRGRNWLFFGERSAHTDFLYCDELQTMSASGHLTRLDTAFSRDQASKIYVQDRMKEQGAELWRWLADGAQVYVCGDASRMAKDVDAALHDVIAQHGSMTAEAAQDYVSLMHDDRRYHRDVY